MADFGKLNYSVSLRPTSAFPLDARCYFESLAEAQAAALTSEEVGSTNTVYYYGQKVVVVADGFATWYTIQPDKTLKVDSAGGTTGTATDSEKLGGQLPSYYAKASDIPSLEGYAKTSDIPTVPTKVSAFDNDKGYLTEHQSLEGYAKTSDIPSLDGYAKASDIPSLDGYAKTSDIPSIPTKVSAFENDKGYLTEHQSLEEYAKNSALEDAVEEMTAIAQGKCACYVFDTVEALDTWLGNTANTEKLKTGDVFLIRAVNVPDYWWDGATKQKLETTKVDLTEYAKKSEIPTVPTKVSAFENDKGYLTQHQDLSSYAKKSEIPTIPSSLPANGGNADTVDGYHIRKVTDTNDTGQTGYITFIV